jgi:heme iron utilization protein
VSEVTQEGSPGGADPVRAAAARIVAHMNEDHADAVADLARVQGGVPSALRAEMTGCDRDGFDVVADTGGGPVPARVPFPSPLDGPEEARPVLIAMLREARAALRGDTER